MLEFDPFCVPKDTPERNQEDGLKFERKGDAQPDHAAGGALLQRIRQSQKGQGGIHAVTLAPVGAVEGDGGEEQKDSKGAGKGVRLGGDMAGQARAGEDQEKVKEEGEGFDEVEVWDGEVGEGSKKVEVGDVVVADGLAEGGKAAVVPEKLYPVGEKVDVVIGLVAQHGDADRQGNHQDDETNIERLLWKLGADEEKPAQTKPKGAKEKQEEIECHENLLNGQKSGQR